MCLYIFIFLYVQTSDCTYRHLFIELSLPATTIPALDNAGSLEPQAKVKIVGTFAATEPKNCPGSSGYGCMDGTSCGFPVSGQGEGVAKMMPQQKMNPIFEHPT